MFARCMILMCFICCATGCSTLQKYSSVHFKEPEELLEPKMLHPTEEVRPAPAFTQVYILGPFNVRLHTDKSKKPSLKIAGDATDLAHVQSYVKQGVLYISVGGKKAHIGKRRLSMGHATLDINVPHLHGFTYKGDGVITAHKIHTGPLNIWLMNSKKSTFSGRMDLRHLTVAGTGFTKITGIHSRDLRIKLIGEPRVVLKGKANLRRVDMEGGASLKLNWVRSSDLIVRLRGSSCLTLAGTVNRLDSVTSDKSHLDARYLRVKEAFVKTNDEAISDVTVTERQHGLARDRSDIYYYNLPDYRMDFMARNGSVLDMRPDELKIVQPDTIYNH